MSDPLSQLCDCVTLIDSENYSRILSTLKQPISDVKTVEGKNIFHLLCLCESKEDTIIKFITQTVKFVNSKQVESSATSSLVGMLNTASKTFQRTPLFEAVWFNKRKIVRKLVELGADTKVRDRDGQSLVHACTICGHLSLLSYFVLEQKLSIEAFDHNQRTPLHLAALEGREQVCAFLIAYTTDLEVKDKDGFTALHLAAFTSSYRTVRHLIMKGAKRKAATPRFTPAKIGEIMAITPEVLYLLQEPNCIQYLNPVSPPLDKVSNSRKTFSLNLIFFGFRFIVALLLQYPMTSYSMIIPSILLLISSLSFLLISSYVSPGYAECGGNLADIYASHKEEEDICAYCSILREKSMKHCHRCNRCVKKFDHHCPWIHNCVGQNNHKYFYFYVLSTDLDFLFHSFLAFWILVIGSEHENGFGLLVNELNILVFIVNICLGTITALLCFALTPLVYVQTVNLITGLTTHDRFARRAGVRDSRVSNLSIPFFDSEQIPMSLLEPTSNTTSVIKEIKVGFCGCSKTVSFVRASGIEELQYTSSLRN